MSVLVPTPLREPLARARGNAPRPLRPFASALPRRPPSRPPLFVLGCPRSGTSLLFKLLRQCDELRSLGDEGHALWEAFHHPAHGDWDSNVLGAEDVTDRERRYVYGAARLVARGRRFLDKTPKNCLRVPYLLELFPAASFVFLRRRAADNVNSLIEGWRAHPRYVTYRLPERLEGLGPLSGRHWSFVLVPAWRELRFAPLEEICARQYVACNEAVLEARPSVGPSRWVDVAYEDLVARPQEEAARILARLGLRMGERTASFAASLGRRPINAVTPPRREKWREQNVREIESIVPLVAATERRLGYQEPPP